MKIIYTSPSDVKEFDINKFHKSLNKYDKVSIDEIQQAIDALPYPQLHYSVLVETGVNLIKDENKAFEYYKDHAILEDRTFERLRRITGYLVGTLDRWNDGKKAEEKARVKHNVDARNEIEKQKQFIYQQNEYHKN